QKPSPPPQTRSEGVGADGASARDTELGYQPIENGRAQSRREVVRDGPEHTAEAMSREASVHITRSRGTAPAASTGIREVHAGAPAATEEPREGDRVRASPLARRIAAEQNIDLSKITGTGPGGRITQRDVVGTQPSAPAREQEKAQGAPASLAPQRVAVSQKEVVPLSKIRLVIAQRLQQSKQQIPHFYETIDIDVQELVKLR